MLQNVCNGVYGIRRSFVSNGNLRHYKYVSDIIYVLIAVIDLEVRSVKYV